MDDRQRPRIGDRLGQAIDTRRVGRVGRRGLLAAHFGHQRTTGNTGAALVEPAHPLSQRVLVGRVRVRGPDVAHGARRRERHAFTCSDIETCQLTVRFVDRLQGTAGRIGRHQRRRTGLDQRQRTVRHPAQVPRLHRDRHRVDGNHPLARKRGVERVRQRLDMPLDVRQQRRNIRIREVSRQRRQHAGSGSLAAVDADKLASPARAEHITDVRRWRHPHPTRHGGSDDETRTNVDQATRGWTERAETRSQESSSPPTGCPPPSGAFHLMTPDARAIAAPSFRRHPGTGNGDLRDIWITSRVCDQRFCLSVSGIDDDHLRGPPVPTRKSPRTLTGSGRSRGRVHRDPAAGRNCARTERGSRHRAVSPTRSWTRSTASARRRRRRADAPHHQEGNDALRVRLPVRGR